MTTPQTFDEACDAWTPTFGEPAPKVVDVKQVVYALERARDRLMADAGALEWDDYSAEFYTEDADRMSEAIALLQARPIA